MKALKQNLKGLDRLKKRSDFLLAAQSGQKWISKTLIIQLNPRTSSSSADHDDPSLRFGLTVSKKVGNAVTRNRVKRRLRSAVKDVLQSKPLPLADIVLIARAGAKEASYQTLVSDLRWSLKRLGLIQGQNSK